MSGEYKKSQTHSKHEMKRLKEAKDYINAITLKEKKTDCEYYMRIYIMSGLYY